MSDKELLLFGRFFISEQELTKTLNLFKLAITIIFVYRAYDTRLYPIHIYGKIIHEFDPWFNYRATEYLSDHGWSAFFEWFDYMSWYPIGRPVGTTIYPGLQITSVAIHRMLNMVGWSMSLNDVCVFFPAWFASIATILTSLLAYECSGSVTASAITAYLFATVPAHLMRSMAGEYDNECIAMAAMVLTFYLWVRSLRTAGSWPIGVLAALGYGYMVSTWGGYIFVLNMVALHAAVCVLVDWVRNTYSVHLLKAYSLFFVLGTAIATRVPPVGWSPFWSPEQLMALLVFIFMWALHFSEVLRRRTDAPVLSTSTLRLRATVFMATLATLVGIAVVLSPTGYFGAISIRVRALFVKHTHTGNPLVDSVAEHQPTPSSMFWAYLHVCLPGWVGGFAFTFFSCITEYNAGKTFSLLYSVVACYFATKMSRLMLLTGPVAAVTTGCLLGSGIDFLVYFFLLPPNSVGRKVVNKKEANAPGGHQSCGSSVQPSVYTPPLSWANGFRGHPIFGVVILTLVLSLGWSSFASYGFTEHCEDIAEATSSPLLMTRARLSTGETVIVDDYYDSYMWLRNNTPEDARILAWWDYGYQITGIGNRTSLADGNTWNHEHIATIGKMLVSPVDEAHGLIRHLADYVLIWCGHRADDLMKSAHMARIGNSVYHDICPPEDRFCQSFGFQNDNLLKPTPMMRRSLVYNLHGEGELPGVYVDKRLFRLVYKSRYGLVKIYKVMNVSKESKAWVADPKNWRCHPPGSWVCPGQYPPAKEIQDLLAKRIDYGQQKNVRRKN